MHLRDDELSGIYGGSDISISVGQELANKNNSSASSTVISYCDDCKKYTNFKLFSGGQAKCSICGFAKRI